MKLFVQEMISWLLPFFWNSLFCKRKKRKRNFLSVWKLTPTHARTPPFTQFTYDMRSCGNFYFLKNTNADLKKNNRRICIEHNNAEKKEFFQTWTGTHRGPTTSRWIHDTTTTGEYFHFAILYTPFLMAYNDTLAAVPWKIWDKKSHIIVDAYVAYAWISPCRTIFPYTTKPALTW